MPFTSLSKFSAAILGAVMLFCAPLLSAQADKPKTNTPDPSIFQIWGGYGFLHPIDSGIDGHQYLTIFNKNVTAGMTYFFSKHFGFQVEGEYFSDNTTFRNYQICAIDAEGRYRCQQDQDVQTAEAGFIYRIPKGRWVPYAHLLAGEQRQDGPVVNPSTTGFAATAGVGVDYVLPFTHNILAVRPIQADLQYGHLNYGPLVLPAGISGGSASITAVKLSAGLVVRLGEIEPKTQVLLSCTAMPTAIYPGDPVMLQASATGLTMKRTATYSWTASGGKMTPGGMNASNTSLDTTGLAPGSYTAAGHVSQGQHPYQEAVCATSFTVQAYEPPTISCTATPAEVTGGTDSMIACQGMSPQNRGLTYSYSSSMGQVTGKGNSAELHTTGVQPREVEITATVMDDLGKTAATNVEVTVEAPPPTLTAISKPVQQTLCGISFERDRRRPVRVDNEAKACLDSIALSMNHDVASTLIIVGHASKGDGAKTAGERAVNAKEYLVQEKGIDSKRVQVRTKTDDARSADMILLPQGAELDDPGTAEFEASGVKQKGEPYGHHKPRQ